MQKLQAPNSEAVAQTLNYWAYHVAYTNPARADHYHQEALRIRASIAHGASFVYSLSSLGWIALALGDVPRAVELFNRGTRVEPPLCRPYPEDPPAELFEGGLSEGMDANWVVVCPRSEQLRRLMTERGMSAELAETRISAQGTQEEKVRQATVVIDNSGTLEDMERQVDAALSAVSGQRGEAPPA